SPAIQKLLAGAVGDAAAPIEARRLALRAMSRAALKDTPPAWIAGLTDALGSGEPELLSEAVTAARTLRLPKQPPATLGAAVSKVGANPNTAPAPRAGALAAVPGGLNKVEPALLDFLRGRLKDDEPVVTRSLAAEALAHASLTPEQLLLVADSLKSAGPME